MFLLKNMFLKCFESNNFYHKTNTPYYFMIKERKLLLIFCSV